MIYKIEFEDVDNINQYFDIFIKIGELFFTNNIFYISTLLKKNEIKNKIKKKNREIEFLIKEINENNLKFQSPKVKSWCKEIFIQEDIKKLEEQEQEKLQEVDNFLTVFLDKIKEKEVSEIGRKENNNESNTE